MTWPSGKKYTGKFMNNKMHGAGVMITENGKTIEGSWEDGKQLK